MFDFHEKRKIRTILYSKISIGIIAILAVTLSISAFARFTVEREMAEKRDHKEGELKKQQARALQLEAEVQHLKDARGIEEELRNRFDVVKEGEQVVVIIDNDAGAESATATDAVPTKEEEKGFFDMFKFW